MNNNPSAYDKKYLIKCLVKFGIFVGAMAVTGGAGFLVILPFLVMALMQRRQEDLLFYLLFMGTVVVGNPKIMPKSMVFFLSQRSLLLLFAGTTALQIFGRRNSPHLTPLLGLMVYMVYMAATSIQGYAPIISYLKIFLFTVCFFAYYGLVNNLSKFAVSSAKIRSILLSLALVYIVGSIALIPFPGISQLSGEAYQEMILAGKEVNSLFKGMTSHSQCLGPVVAGLVCVLLGDLLFGVQKADKLYIFILLLSPVVIYLTSSRTAFGTYLIGILSVLFFFMRTRFVKRTWKSKVLSVAMVLVIFGGIVMLCFGSTRESAAKFLMKGADSSYGVSWEAMTSSRMGLVENAMYHFKQKPVFGNGFQVNDETAERYTGKGIKNMLSAPVEKGVWVSAVLEEGGVIGFALFVWFICSAIILFVKRKSYVSAAMFVTFLVSNLGEFTFFSLSYTGGFLWALLFLGTALDIARVKDAERRLAFGYR